MKTLTIAICFIACLTAPRSAWGQSGQQTTPSTKKDAQAFCHDNPKSEIRAFCPDLAELQSIVSKAAIARNPNLDSTNPDFTDALNKLNLASPRAVVNFITATAAAFATRSAASNALQDAGQARPDRQLGTNANQSGTTSLVSKAGSAELLSLALDAGALTQSVKGTTATLGMNGDQIFRLITGSDPDCTVTCNSLGWLENKVLNPINITSIINLAQQSTTTTPTTGQASGTSPVPVGGAAIPTGAAKLAGISAKYQLMNKFDPRSEKFKTAWKKQVTSLAGNVKTIGDDTDAVSKALLAHKPFSNTQAEQEARFQPVENELVQASASDPTGQKLIEVFDSFWNEVVTSDITGDATLASSVEKVAQDRAVYRDAWFQALDETAGNLLTFEYDFNRPINQPETHDFKIIYAYSFKSAGMLTFNGAASVYGGELPPGARYGRLRYGQVSGEYDRTLTGKDKSIQTQLTLAGYWQYQPNPSVLNIPAGTVAPGTTIPLPNGTQEFVGTAGSLWVTQAKLTIKASGGITVPIGVSWSNKTDLLQGSRVGAQVGISYNFSSLAGLFGGGASH
jgi:hypothetical protein